MIEPAQFGMLNQGPSTQSLYGRLSIAHLLLITAGSAIAVWLQQPPGATSDVVAVAVAATFAPVYGTALAAMVIALRQWPTKPLATQPGHSLLLLIGSSFAGLGLALRIMFIMNSPGVSVLVAVLLIAAIVIAWPLLLTMTLAFFLQAIRDSNQSAQWRRVFWLIAVSFFLPCLLPALPAVVLYATIEDVRRQRRYDLWHWLGVVALFGVVAHVIALWVTASAQSN